MAYSSVKAQRPMVLDGVRNAAYAKALQEIITPASVVLDVGAGMGVLGLLAAQAGARRVYLAEPEDVLALAAKTAQAHGWGARVTCLPGRIEEVELPERVDVIVSVFTGNFLLEEDLLPSLFYARDKYLKPGGALLPSRAVMEAVPVSAPELHQREVAAWSEPHAGLDFSAARSYAANAVCYDKERLAQARYLAAPAPLLELDFYAATDPSCHSETVCVINEAGLCHGWAGWFRMELGGEWLSTAPHAAPLHWSPAFLPLDPPLPVAAGERMSLRLERPVYGEWSWRVETAQARQQHSTFLATPLSPSKLKKAALNYRPQLTEEGRAWLFALSNFDGQTTAQELAAAVREKYPRLYPDLPAALAFVQRLAKWHG
jgi:hypothetical protein